MVVTRFPASPFIGVEQLRTASPFTWTVHAPHNPIPQPYFVPVSPSSSRRNHNNGISPSPSKRRDVPFTDRSIIVTDYRQEFAGRYLREAIRRRIDRRRRC